MKAKGKARRKILKNLRQEKLKELLNNETQSDNTIYLFLVGPFHQFRLYHSHRRTSYNDIDCILSPPN